MRVIIAAGGTGGHVLPGLAAARELSRRGHRAHFIVKTDDKTQAFLAKEGFASSSFMYAGFPRGFSPRLFTFPFMSLQAYAAARRILKREAPDLLLGMGGYVSVPAGAAARRLGVPLVLHEQNSLAGLANRLLSRWASAVAVSFESTRGLSAKGGPARWTGLPLRGDLRPLDPVEARKRLGLDGEAMTFLVFGGSQGARALNRFLTGALPRWAGKKGLWQFIHLTGAADRESVEAAYRAWGGRFFVQPYWNDMATLYSAADFVVGRSGANTVMELARMGKRALLVPFPFATDNHQEFNARHLEGLGLAKVVLERGMSVEALQSVFEGLPPAGALREENARRLREAREDGPGAASRLVDLMEEIHGKKS